MDKYVVIMAGGAGTRFWPLSREKKPKQFISVDGNQSMLVQTIKRVCQVVPQENCFIITNQELVSITQDTVKGILPLSNIIEEPLRKNTATCIAYATLLLKQKLGSGLLSFLPADAYVKDNINYAKALDTGYKAANQTKSLVTIGINPTYPATGYGYIQIDTQPNEEEYSKIIRFVEKPDTKVAEQMVQSNEYLWNSGIVIGDMDVLIEHFKIFLPEHYYKIMEALTELDAADYNEKIKRAYQDVISISFDVSVLEKCPNIYTVKGMFDWDDMGSMEALSKALDIDSNSNFVRGNFTGIDTSECIIYGDEILIATIGIEKMAVVYTKDAIVICPRSRVQDIKVLINELKINGYENFI